MLFPFFCVCMRVLYFLFSVFDCFFDGAHGVFAGLCMCASPLSPLPPPHLSLSLSLLVAGTLSLVCRADCLACCLSLVGGAELCCLCGLFHVLVFHAAKSMLFPPACSFVFVVFSRFPSTPLNPPPLPSFPPLCTCTSTARAA